MGLADTFQQIVDSLPDDWTDLELDLRDRRRVALRRSRDCPRRRATRSPTRTTTGTGACSSPTASATPPRRRPCTARCSCSTRPGIDGELALREMRSGRVEVTQMWGRPRVGARGVPPPARAVAMARVVALVPDLLFGSACRRRWPRPGTRSSSLGGEPLPRRAGRARRRTCSSSTSPPGDSTARRSSRRSRGGALPRRALGFYSHVEPEARERARRRASTSSSRARAWPARARSRWSTALSPLALEREPARPARTARDVGRRRRSRSASPTRPSASGSRRSRSPKRPPGR